MHYANATRDLMDQTKAERVSASSLFRVSTFFW